MLHSNDVNLKNDYIEISFLTISNNEIDTEYKPIKVYLRSLEKSTEKDDVWTLPMQSLVNLKYMITEGKSTKIGIKQNEDLYSRIENPFKIAKEEKSNLKLGVPINPHDKQLNNEILNTSSLHVNFLIGNDQHMATSSVSSLNMESIPYWRNNAILPNKVFQDSNAKLDSSSYEILESNKGISNIDDIYSSDFISKLNYAEIDYDTFIHSIFISGLRNDSTELIPYSEEFPSPCQHKECSILPAFQPNVLYQYQNTKKRYHLDITDNTSNLCFPLGIKLCYKSTDNHNKELPRPYKPFLNVIKNEKGEMYFIAIFHYFKRISIDAYDKKYKLNPLKEYTKVLNAEKIESDQIKFASNLQIISSFITTEAIYIPECITLVSRFPFFQQMSTCLRTILSLNDDSDRNELICHLINEIPIPTKDKKMLIYIPYNTVPIELHSPFKPNISNFTKRIILKHLSIGNIVFIFNLILHEQKILFIENDYSVLSSISFAFFSFIYPFCWMNTYIPVLSLSTVAILQSIIPFIMGIDDSLFNYSIKQECIDDNSKIVYIDIKSNSLFLSPSGRKHLPKKQILKEIGVDEFPKSISSFLTSKLKEVKKMMSDSNNSSDSIEEKLRESFCETTGRIIGDYKTNMFITDNDAPLFNSECYLDKKDKEDRKYYQELVQNQLFTQFLFNEKELLSREKNAKGNNQYGIFRDNCVLDTSYYHTVYDNYILSNSNSKAKRRMKSKQKDKETWQKSISRNSSCNKKENDNDNNNNNKNDQPLNTYQIGNSVTFNDIYSNLRVSKNDSYHSNLITSKNDNSIFQSHTISNRMTIKTDKTSNIQHANKQTAIILSPYFIDNPLFASSKSKIEEYISNQIKKQKISRIDGQCYIIDDGKTISLNNIKDTYRRYFFMNKSRRSKSLFKDVKKTLNTNPFKGMRRKSISSNNLLEGITNFTNTSSVAESISDWFTNLCTTDMKNRFKLIDISSLMQTEINRTFFSNLINQNKKIHDKTVKNSYKTLNAACFNELMKSIKSALRFCGLNEHQTCKSLTIACFLYFKIVNGVNVFIYEEYVKTFKPCRQWLSTDFWVNWFDYDLSQISHKEADEDSEDDNEGNDGIIYNKGNDFELFPSEWRILLRLEKTMAKLKLNKEFIKQVIINHLAMKYLEHEYLVQYQEEFIIRRDY